MPDSKQIPIFSDSDADLDFLDGVIAVIGYGNQGRAQALNLSDSGLDVVVGNIRDEYWDIAAKDGLQVMEIREAVETGRVVLFLIPDEVQPQVFEEHIRPVLTSPKVLCFASGYNIAFGQIDVQEEIDTIMVAPRMIGSGVRESFLNDRGFYTFIGVHNNKSGRALDTALAITKGIGSLKLGGAALGLTFRQEAELDLFNEQCFGPAFGNVLTTAVDVAIEAGYPPEAVLIDIYMSGEFSYNMKMLAELGSLKQLELHSPCSQYGSMTRTMRYVNPDLPEQMRTTLAEIQDGSFVAEFTEEYKSGMQTLADMKGLAEDMPLVFHDAKVRERLKKIDGSDIVKKNS